MHVQANALRSREADLAGRPLSRREREILVLLAEGNRRAEIASRLFVAPSTVTNHLRAVFRKLSVETAAQAVTFAYRNGLVEVGPHV